MGGSTNPVAQLTLPSPTSPLCVLLDQYVSLPESIGRFSLDHHPIMKVFIFGKHETAIVSLLLNYWIRYLYDFTKANINLCLILYIYIYVYICDILCKNCNIN